MDPDQRFSEFIDAWAARQNCTFETESYDGRESLDLIDGMAVDDVWGWLIPNGETRKDAFYGVLCWRLENDHLQLDWKYV